MGPIWWVVGTRRAPASAVCFSNSLKFTVGEGGVPRTPVAKQESLMFSGFPLGTGLQGLLERWPAMEPQVGWMGSKVLSHWMGSGGGVQNQKFLLVHSHHSSFLPSCLR